MLNTLANHHYLPHDGNGIDRTTLISALRDALNFDEYLASRMFDHGVVANPDPEASDFSLAHLNEHNVLEHDASLSRLDAYFGNPNAFSSSIFAVTKSFWTSETLNVEMLTNAKLARQIQSRAFNPEYTFTDSIETFSLGEIAAPIVAFGDLNSATVRRDLVVYFFENERLPTNLGWERRTETVTVDDVMRMSGLISNASNLITGKVNVNPETRNGACTDKNEGCENQVRLGV